MSRRPQKRSMFLRMLARAAVLRKRTALAALLAIVVAAAAATAMLNLFVDVQDKLAAEFRKFGANVVVEGADGGTISGDELMFIQRRVGDRGLAVPFSYAVAQTDRGQPVVVAGTDLGLARQLNPWWAVSSWPHNQGQALIGVRAKNVIHGAGAPFTLYYRGRPVQFSSAGELTTGSDEDSHIYVSFDDFDKWTGLDLSAVEIAASGSPEQVNSLATELRQAFPWASVRIVRQIAEGEANVLGKTRSTLLASSAFIVCTAALCVLATLMGWVFDRRRDFAIMKALGASDRLIALFVAGEAAVLGSVGAVLGFSAGIGIAAWIGRANFHASVSPRFELFPLVLAGCLFVTISSTVPPLRLLRRIQPAMILRGE